MRISLFVLAFIASWLSGCQKIEAQLTKRDQARLGATAPPSLNLPTRKTLGDFRFAVADMVEKVMPVVVSIRTEAVARGPQMPLNPLEEFFFGPRAPGQRQDAPRQQGLGSGVIVSADGFVLTNNHVIEGADNIILTLADRREFKAEVVGTDPQTDLAVIRIQNSPKDLPVAFLGISDSLRVGEWVVAIGNPFGLSHTVTTGVVSAKGVHNRGITSYENFIQTDAAINPGNSGGALYNLSGELVGINTAILSRTGGFQGIGFAIPIDLARIVLQDLIQHGRVSRGWLGVSIQDMDPALARAMKIDSLRGAVVNEVFKDSPAEKAGIKAGDVLISIEGRTLRDANDLRHSVALLRPGSTAEFSLIREGKVRKVRVTVAARDEAEQVTESGAATGNERSLGIEVANLTDEQRRQSGLKKEEGGVLVQSLTPDGPAARAGLRQGDIILRIDNKDVRNVASFREAARLEGQGTQLFLVRRGNGRMFIAVER